MTIALDVGASKIRIADVTGTKVKNKVEIKTPKTKSAILGSLTELIENFTEKKPREICIGMAGIQKNGLIINSPNLPAVNNVNIKSFLEKKFKTKVYVENDVHCAGLAEKYFGYGKKYRNWCMLTLGTGIGGATFVNGKLFKGQGIGMEPGQMLIEGKRFEEIASGPASVRLARQKGIKGDSFKIEELAKKGNKKAISVYDEIGRRLGIGLLNISYIYDPEIIILGGGFAKVKFIWKNMLKTLYNSDMAKRKIPVRHAKLSDDAGLIGAALLSKKNLN